MPTLDVVHGDGAVASEEFSISTLRSFSTHSPEPLDFVYDSEISVEVVAPESGLASEEFAGESGDEQLDWTMLGTSGFA